MPEHLTVPRPRTSAEADPILGLRSLLRQTAGPRTVTTSQVVEADLARGHRAARRPIMLRMFNRLPKRQ
jgi:hypothetical protein